MPTGDQLSVSLSADPNPAYTDPDDPAYDPNDVNGKLWGDAVMVHPLWPMVTIRAGQSDQPYTEKDDWVQSWQPISIPVEDGSGNRVQIRLNAAIDEAYEDVTDWTAALSLPGGATAWNCGVRPAAARR